MKVAVVAQRYGPAVNGGAELHARYIAEHLARHTDVEVLTTCATDYVTWRNELPEGLEQVNGIAVRRFRVSHERDPIVFAKRSARVFDEPHSLADELSWLDAEGPTSPTLIAHIARHANDFDYCIFFSYRDHHAVHGVRAAAGRAILVPTAERDAAIGLSIFKPIFRGVRALMYNSPEERAMIQAVSDNAHVPSVVVGIGSDVPANPQPGRFRQKFNLRGRFAVYVGRIDENKGCKELFEFFTVYLEDPAGQLSLVLIGHSLLPIPEHPRIRALGFLDDADKFDAMAAADVLIMPSYFESLSMVALEAWALGRPVLANGKCDVLKGQTIRSNAGLYYNNRVEFVEVLRAIEDNRWLSGSLGRNGRQFFREHYDWPVIERKYGDMLQSLSNDSTAPSLEPLPGWLERRKPTCPAGMTVVGSLPTGPCPRRRAAPRRRGRRRPGDERGTAGATRRASAPLSAPPRPLSAPSGSDVRRARRRPMIARPAVHQVLATLGYGDAIGHEVLGIQRALRAAGYESDIFVETADRRLERLTRDYRELIDASRPGNLLLHHFSIGSKASRTAYALPDRMALVYHNITPPEYFAGIHRTLARQCFRGRRELGAYVDRCDLALGDSEFNREDLEHLGFRRTAVLPVVPDFSHLAVTPDRFIADQFDDAWTNVLFVGRVIANKKIEDVIRFFHAYHTRFNPRSRLLIVGAFNMFERYLAALHHMIEGLGLSHVHFAGQVSDAELVAYYDVADLFLCASEHEGFCVPLVEAFAKEIPVLAYAATAVPATMDGAGVLYADKDPWHVAELMDAVLSDTRLQDAIVLEQTAAVHRLQARDFSGTLLAFVDRILGAPRADPPRVASEFWREFDAAEAMEELRMYRPSAYKALPAIHDSRLTGDKENDDTL